MKLLRRRNLKNINNDSVAKSPKTRIGEALIPHQKELLYSSQSHIRSPDKSAHKLPRISPKLDINQQVRRKIRPVHAFFSTYNTGCNGKNDQKDPAFTALFNVQDGENRTLQQEKKQEPARQK